jgi:hypothetical protein
VSRSISLDDEDDQPFRGEVVWTSRDGKYVVVKGPFPYGLIRSADSEDIETAKNRKIAGILGLYQRGETTRAWYAKMMAAQVEPTTNHLGEVAP